MPNVQSRAAQDKILFPDDSSLPYDTYYSQNTTPGGNLGYNQWNESSQLPNTSPWNQIIINGTNGPDNITLNASAFVITEDGTVSGGSGATVYTNNWFANTNGLYAAPVDSNGGTLGGYNPGPGAAGSSKFTDTVGALNAGATGNVTFKVQVK